MTTTIPFFAHDLGAAELAAVAEVLAGPILTTGETVARFEARFAAYLGARHAVGMTSCTGAIHLALEAFGIGDGDEVITTPMTFIATATAILQAGARPVFVDVEPTTGNLDPAAVEAAITSRTKAIVPVHLYGLMCDMRALRAIADRHGLKVIEDAAHCIEGERDGARPGALGDAACFSFYATKAITCGEGGALVVNDADLAARLRLLRLHGMNKSAADRQREGYQHWDMVEFGWKYNMDNIQAALLLPQMERMEANCERRAALAEAYRAQIRARGIDVALPSPVARTRHAHHLFPVWTSAAIRDDVVGALQAQGVGVVVNYRAIHLLSYLRDRLGYPRGSFPNAERIGDSTLSLPLYPTMPIDHVAVVVAALEKAVAGAEVAR